MYIVILCVLVCIYHTFISHVYILLLPSHVYCMLIYTVYTIYILTTTGISISLYFVDSQLLIT